MFIYIRTCTFVDHTVKERHHHLPCPCTQSIYKNMPHNILINTITYILEGDETFIKSTNNSGIFPTVFLQCRYITDHHADCL